MGVITNFLFFVVSIFVIFFGGFAFKFVTMRWAQETTMWTDVQLIMSDEFLRFDMPFWEGGLMAEAVFWISAMICGYLLRLIGWTLKKLITVSLYYLFCCCCCPQICGGVPKDEGEEDDDEDVNESPYTILSRAAANNLRREAGVMANVNPV